MKKWLGVFTLLSAASLFFLTQPEASASGTLVDLTTGGVATASSKAPTKQTYFYPEYSFDDIIDSKDYWNAGSVTSGWLEYQFPASKRIQQYTLMWGYWKGYESYMPRDWTFEAFDEGTAAWVVLDSQTSQSNWVFGQKKAYTITNDKFYKRYRINVSRSNAYYNVYPQLKSLGIYEMEMLGDPSEVPLQFDIDTTNAVPYGGQAFETYLVSRYATGLQSEQVTVKYDPELYEFILAQPQNGFVINNQTAVGPGELQFQLSSQGAVFSTADATRMVKLNFRAKDKAGTGRIETTAGQAVTGTGAPLEATFGGESIRVSVKQGDVNLDGSVTVGDLAMAGYAHSGAPVGNYSRSDVDGNGIVDDADLQVITDKLEAIPFTDGGLGYTFDLTQGGDVTASSTHTSYQFYQPRFAFDGDTTSGFYWNAGTKVPSGWLTYEFRFPQRVGKYSLLWQKHVGYEAYMPKNWTFEGYDEQTGQWVVLDTRTNETGWATGQKREFEFANENYYKKYRVNISASNHASYVGVGEMEMFGIVEKTIDITNPGGVIDWGITRELDVDMPREGDVLTMSLLVGIADDIFAEESVVEYDPNQFEYLGTTAVTGTRIYKEEPLAPGKIRFVTAQTGAGNGIQDEQGNNVVAHLKFQIKPGGADSGYGSMRVSKGTVATSKGVDIQPALTGVGFSIFK